MSPLPGIYASQISGHLFQPSGAYDSIAVVTLSGTTASVSFDNIPAGYKHLQLVVVARETTATVGGQSQMRINGDTGANYTYHTFYANGTTAGADGTGPYNWSYGIDRHTGGNDPANIFGANIIDYVDYGSTSKYKTVRSFGGYDANGSGQMRIHSSLWMSFAPITSLYFENQGGGSYAANTQFALYGIK